MKTRYKATIGYNGQNYHGWARQPNGITIQGILEDTIYKVFNQKVIVYGSGRTDAGVNAIGQVIHFDLKKINIKPKNLIQALNKALPYDIRVLSLNKTSHDFNARFSAKHKTYIYSINIGKVNPIESSFIYQYNKKLDLAKMRKIGKLFVGKRNFLSFSTDARDGESVIKQVNRLTIKRQKDLVKITVNGNGFLRSQVRMMVGTMIAYSEGKITLEEINNCFNEPKKGRAMFKAPACGLCLYKVTY